MDKINDTDGIISENLIRELVEEHPEFSIREARYVSLFIGNSHVSLDTPIGNHDSNTFTLLDIIADKKLDIERSFVYKKDLQKMRDWAIQEVRKRQKPAYYEVIITDYLFSTNPRDLQDIAKQFNVISQFIQTAELHIKRMIRRHFRVYEVNTFFPSPQ